MLAQAPSSQSHQCSSCPTNSLPDTPGVCQPETRPPSEPRQAPQSKASPIHRLEVSTTPLGPRPRLQSLPTCRSHRPRRRREVLLLLTPTSIRLEPPTPPLDSSATPLLLAHRQLLHASPTPRTRLATPPSHHRGIPINTNRTDSPLLLPAALSP